MPPENRLGQEKKRRAKGSVLTHPTSRKWVERPHPNQEHKEVDEVLYVDCLYIGKDFSSCLFDDRREHHECRTIVFKMITGNGNTAVLRPGDVRLKRVG